MSTPDREAEVGHDAASADADRAVAPSSPDGFKLEPELPSVMRLSRKTLAVIGGAAGLAIGGALLWALRMPNPVPAENLHDSERANRSEVITGAPADYGSVPKLGPPLPGDLGRPIVSAQKNGEMIPVPPIGAESEDPAHRAAEQARERRIQEGDAARASNVFLASSGTRSPGEDPADAARPAAPAPGVGETKAAVQGLLGRSAQDRSQSGERIAAPPSPYILQAGSLIPAALITGIRSDLPGQITAQVTQNVYDSPTGQILLIPQGARLVGEYDSEIVAGQNRVLIAWDRLILPGGASLALGRLPGADAAGMAGLADHTDHHWGHMFKAALLSTLLGAGAELGSTDEDAIVRAIRGGSQDSIGETGRQIIGRQLGIPPTITIRSGHPFHVIVTRDLVLEPMTRGMPQ